MRGDEARVVAAFCVWLERNGWYVRQELNFIDVVAERDGVTLYAEAKGRTSSIGLDVDTLYGQLLRRVPSAPHHRIRFGVVVPTEAVTAALRVPAWVRDLLGITVYCVDLDGGVHEVSGTPAIAP